MDMAGYFGVRVGLPVLAGDRNLLRVSADCGGTLGITPGARAQAHGQCAERPAIGIRAGCDCRQFGNGSLTHVTLLSLFSRRRGL
jgi:hypothetical protein